MIVVERQIFNEWKSSHPNANGLYNKPFSYFEDLRIAFGRDRAQGGNAENVTQAENATIEAERKATLNDRQVNKNTQVNLEETEMKYEADSQVCKQLTLIHVHKFTYYRPYCCVLSWILE
ncbi:putative protein-like [Arachis hypogaea]|nr:putative protein-like [Arachis hypogaea]